MLLRDRLKSSRHSLLPSSACAIALLLSACGGSSDSVLSVTPAPTAAPTATPQVITGKVLGSYFRNAKVCLDSNNNARCDENEVSTRSDKNGQFSLAGSNASITAEIGTDATEFDPTTNTESKVTSRIVLRAPKEATSTVSLHSSSIVAEMENNALSFADAKAKVAIAVGVTREQLLSDFNIEKDAVVAAALKNASDDGIKRIRENLALAGSSADPKAILAAMTMTDRYYQTKSPYRPQQDPSSYEKAPAGFTPVYTQMLARHGSRGLSSLKYDLAIHNMWSKAKAEGALTPLGEKLGEDTLKIMKANFLLGCGVEGITQPGYGNLTQVGINEHKQLAVRMLNRMPDFWKQVADDATAARKVQVVTSGVDRAVDSGNFFAQSLKTTQPKLSNLLSYPAAPGPFPDKGTAVPQAAGTDRFQLYFHKLVAKTDLVSNVDSPFYATYQASLAYQAFKKDADLIAKQEGLFNTAEAKAKGRQILERLFSKAFVDKVENGSYSFANTGSFTFSSADGKCTAPTTLSGDGETKIASTADAASLLYELYVIAPAMRTEAGVDFSRYMPAEQARFFAELNDASDFYDKGPGMTEKGDVTYKMSQMLFDDFFKEMDAIAANNLGNAAKLRFAHAEIVAPFASRMGLKKVMQQVPKAETFSYKNNPWRGDYVSPMAANMQWDVYRNAAGKVIVKMLYNEKETDFMAKCDSAKLAANSYFYDYAQLKACYGK
ncbi:histidine-type phosphatase [Deefgea tanakiae]|uniref:Histidine-type phosphatase n=1 Tax=Deefgea tanakiae TaxID=2865840 RepID=A0ABX8Z7W8_9NEIS|nr:histidine-type phosphatase [Deefgea tanakiae]QZA77444.1 histidine-type phosphatase [Deefgea tanakiae]